MVRNWIYRVGTVLLTLVLKLLFHLEVRGRECIPQQGGALLVARHRSYWDIPLLIAAFGPRNRIHFIARHTLLRNPLFYPFVKGFAITIDRDRFRREDLRKVRQAVQDNRIVGIFPEGTTRPTHRIRTGVIRFAEQSRKPFLPVRLETKGPYPPRYPLGFPRVRVWIGRPFTLEALEGELEEGLSRPEHYRRLGSLLMARIDATGCRGEAELSGIASASTKCYDVEDAS